MTKIFITSDSHFFHTNSLKFYNKDGSKLRPWEFSELGMKTMNEYITNKWNSVVSSEDLVYHLGDVTFNSNRLYIMEKLNGKKRLILGNHDDFSYNIHRKYFEKIYSSHRINTGMFLTHIPVHPDSIPVGYTNVHGHIHGEDIDDPRYLNVCVEHTDYTPISLEEVTARILEKRKKHNVI
jgi:calcineurin-like phosphoesterase family protein